MGAAVGNKGAFSDINMTPLIDIVLVVLIIMMVNIPIQIEEMGLKLPSPNPPKPPPDQPPPEQLVLSAYEDGRLALNREAISDADARYEMQRRLKAMSNKNVFIDAHTKVPYGRVVGLVDLAREAGAVNVGLAKLKLEGPLPPTKVHAGGMPKGVFIGSPLVKGAINEKDADAGIQPLKAAIQQCYFTELATNPTLNGELGIVVIVGEKGETGATNTYYEPPRIETDSLNDPELATCVGALLPQLQYKELGTGNTARIRYTILFSPG